MAFNIMDLVKQYTTTATIGATARMLGEDQQKTAGAVAGAIPALLAGLLGASSQPGGEKAFAQAIDKADPGLIGNVKGALDSSGRYSMLQNGTRLLGSLFGDSKLTALASAIAGFSGLSEGSSKSLLGLAAPLVMSLLAKKGQTDGLDSKGLLNMLMGQKDNIAKAIPADLGDALAGSGLLDGLASEAPARPMAAMSQPASKQAAAATPSATSESEAPKKKRSFLVPLILLALLAGAAWFGYQYLMQPRPGSAPVTPKVTSTPATPQPAALSTDVTSEILDDISTVMAQTESAFEGITSEASARSALPALESIDSELAALTSRTTELTASQRRTVAQHMTSLVHTIQAPVENALALPGVEAVVGEQAKSIVDKLKQLSQ